jgi:hypothetical protein
MTSTATHPSTSVGRTASTYRPATGRRISRRTTWILAGTAALAIASASAAVVVGTSDDDAAVSGRYGDSSWSARADAAESSHGHGPNLVASAHWRGPILATVAEVPVVRRGAEASQLAHGTQGSLRDAAGRPLAP